MVTLVISVLRTPRSPTVSIYLKTYLLRCSFFRFPIASNKTVDRILTLYVHDQWTELLTGISTEAVCCSMQVAKRNKGIGFYYGNLSTFHRSSVFFLDTRFKLCSLKSMHHSSKIPRDIHLAASKVRLSFLIFQISYEFWFVCCMPI